MKIIKNFLLYKIAVWVLVLFIGVLSAAWLGGYLNSPFQSNLQVNTSTSIAYIEKVEETVFLNAGIQKVITASDSTKFFGVEVPWSKKTALIILRYKAKFGIKQSVKIKQLNKDSYQVTVPKFEVIGFELDKNKPYELYDDDGELLSYSTKKIDTGKLVTKELDTSEQKKFMENYKTEIEESAKSYYEKMLHSIVPDSQVEVRFE